MTSLAATLASALPEPVRCPRCGTVIRVQWRRNQSRKQGRAQWSGFHPRATRPEPCAWDFKFWPSADTEADAREVCRTQPPKP
jgi:hypothetical protein